MDVDKRPSSQTGDSLCVCVACEKVRFGTELWDEYDIKSLLNPEHQISHGLCPVCEKRLHYSLGLMSRLQAF